MLQGLMEVILYVNDMAEAVEFYRDRLGLEVEYPQSSNYRSEYWVVFNTGVCKLCLHGGSAGEVGADAPKIVFRVNDIHASLAQLRDRGVALGEIRSPSPGVFVTDGFDPAGNPFSIEQA